MILKRNEIPTSDTFGINYLATRNVSDDTHNKISSALNSADMMYNNSSVMEDIILEEFLSLYTQAKDIDFAGKNKNLAVESFLTTQLSDGSFDVTSRLNIDTQNGNIILPVSNTTDIQVSSIIIESDSNGSSGDSFSGGANNDINVILDSSSQAIFEYEKITSSPDDDNLMLTLMFELKEETIMNGAYIKLFTTEPGIYPSIDIVDISSDGIKWNSVKSFGVTGNLNKADYFLRFLPQNVRYIRIRFIQSNYNSLRTAFGFRYRYLVGIREIVFKQIQYDDTGSYISVPFSTGRPINSVKFRYNDISNNDIRYLISGNNGGRWIPVNENGSTISVTNENAGIYDGNEIRTIRVKMSMDKTDSVLSKISKTEYLSLSPNNKYYLKQAPEDIEVSCGRHISFGREVRYECDRQVIPSTNFLVRYVPYTAAITANPGDGEYLRVYVDGVLQDPSVYTKDRSDNPNNFEINFNEPVLGNSLISVDFKEVSYTPASVGNRNSNIIKLPVNMFYDFESDIVIKEKQIGSTEATVLAQDLYQILSRNEVKIQDSAFRKDSTYYVSYTPAFEVKNSYIVSGNEVEINSMYIYTTSLRFDYTYRNIYDVNLKPYYTPIGQEYSLEIQ